MPFNPVFLGILFLLIGMVIFLPVWGLLRLIPRLRAEKLIPDAPPDRAETAPHGNAVVVVQAGGRVEFVNAAAREWFNLREGEQPNLELLASRIRSSEEFLRICAAEGQGRFSLNGRPLECTSYRVPGQAPSILVAMSRPEISSDLRAGANGSGSALKILSDFNRAVSTKTELLPAVRAILENLEHLVPADSLEIKLMDTDREGLVSYRFVAGPRSGRRLEKGLPQPAAGYTAALVENHKPLFLPDAQSAREASLKQVAQQTGIRSFIGLPLVVGKMFVGTLEASLTSAEAYSREDLETLRLVAGSAATTLRNASLLDQEQRQAVALNGLDELARVLGSARDTSDLFTRLVKSLSPLFDVQTLGFLIYNESHRALEAQVPFTGMPAQVVKLYQVPVAAGGALEERFLKQEVLKTQNAAEDELWEEMGFQDYALAASWRDSALIPLVSSGHVLGYLQIANHTKPEYAFSPEEMRLLSIVVNQAAPIIDNVMLVQQSRQRAQRSEALRRIASLAASSATADEVLHFTVQELARLLQADLAAIFLLDETRGLLRLHEGSLFGLPQESPGPLPQLFAETTEFRSTATGSRRALIYENLSEEEDLPPAYRPLVDALGMESAIFVPLVVRERSLGELLITSRQAGLFKNSDLQAVSTAAGQLATFMGGATYFGQTDESLQRRVDQLTAMTRISRELNATMDWQYLLQVVYDEALRTTRADCGTIQLFDLESADQDPPKVVFSLGDKVGPKLLPIEQEALKTGSPVVVADFLDSQYTPSHEGMLSALVVPIAYQQSKAGLIHLHSFARFCFDQTAVEIIQTLAIQAAIALGNAQRFQEQARRNELLNLRAQTLSKLFETTSALVAEQPLEQALESLAYGIQEATPFQVVLISIVERETMTQRRVAGVGLPLETLQLLKSHQQPWSNIEQLLKPEFTSGTGYFIPYDKRPLLSSDLQLVTVISQSAGESPLLWHPDDALIYPITDTEGNPIGLISLDGPRDGLRPNRATLETVEIFIAQAALIIQSKQRLTSYKAQVERLTTSLDRQQQLLSISQSHLPMLLHKDLEQMIAIRNLERRAQRIRAGLEITEIVNQQVDAPSMLRAFGREVLTRLEMSVSLIAENTPEGPRLLEAVGNIPRGASPEALFGQRNPLRHTLQTGETLLAMNLDQDDAWRESALLSSLHAKAFICLPILQQEKPVAGVLALSTEPLPPLTDEDRQVYYQISRQVSIILHDISLLNETSRRLREVNLLLDFSLQLSGLDAEKIVLSLLENALKVVKPAHAGIVFLLDPATGLLVPRAAQGYADVPSLMQITYASDNSLPGQVFASRKPRCVDEVNFTRDYTLSAEFHIRYLEATSGRLPVSSLLIPIQIGERHLGLLMLDNFNATAAFTSDDEALLLSLSQQVALSLENVRLVQASQERAVQLQALTNVASTLTSSLQSGELVSGLLDRLRNVLPFDTAILWLRQGAQMSVAAARGFPDNEQRLGLTVAIEDSHLLAEMNRISEGIVVGDVRSDPRFLSRPEAERLSWMGVPLVSKGEVIGVLALEKTEPNFFTTELLQLATTYASQAAIAFENARLYEDSLRRAAELDQRSTRMALLNRLSSELSGSLNEDQVLRLTANELQQALAAQKVIMVSFNNAGAATVQMEVPEPEEFEAHPLPSAPIFDRLRESLGVFNTDNVVQEADLEPLHEFLQKATSLLVLPLAVGQSLRALAFVHLPQGYRSSPLEIELARTISNQAAIALESARLYQATASRADQLATLNRASFEIGSSLDPEQIYASIHRAAAQLMFVESFVISLLDEEHDEIEGVYLMDPSGRSPNQRFPSNQGISGRVIGSGNALLISDASLVDSGGKTYGKGESLSILAVPITIAGKTIGMLSVQSFRPGVYTDDDQQILSTLANQAAVAIQNGRLFAETSRLAEELEKRVIERTAELAREQRNTETLLRILTEASSSLDLDRALNRTLALLNDAIGAEQGNILLVDEKDNTIHYRAGYGYMTPVMTEGGRPTPLKSGEGLAGWAIKNRQSVCIEDLRKDERWKVIPYSATNHRSVIVAPLSAGEEVIGAIMVFHRQVGYFTPEHINLVQAIGSQVAVAINNAKLYELIRDQAERLGTMYRSEQVEASRQQAILEAVADGVLVTDAESRINFINSSAERILMLKSGEVLGQQLEKFVGLFGAAAQTWMLTIRSWAEDPTAYQPGDTYAEQLNLENGRVALVHLAPVIWKSEFLGTVSIFRDITHEVEVDRLKSEFVATVSHELRTPMTSIKGYVDILLMGAAGALNENQTHFLDIVRSNTERLSILVNDLLDISRIEAGRVSLSLQPIDLREVADDVVAAILRRSQEESKPMALTVNAPPDLPRVTGDLERVRQIIDNLLDNAYNYTPANGQIHIRMQLVEGMVQVDVQDTGVGISPDDKERVFERFYRGEDSLVLATPGTGLGLAIVKQLIAMHKGKIWMESTGVPGQGSTFSFTLPVHKA